MKRSVRVTALLLACILLLLSCGCVGGKGTVPAAAVHTVTGEITERAAAVKDPSLHLIDPNTLGSPMASSGLMQLFLDDNSFGIALYEKTRKKFWYAMPAKTNAQYDYSASSVTLDVLCGNTLYKLNSQDDCMQYRNAAHTTFGDSTGSGMYVTYVLTADEATARKTSAERILKDAVSEADFARTDIAFRVRVTYKLQDGNLYVSAEWQNLSANPDAIVCDLSLLPFFGASSEGESGDFFLLPDGCGTLIHTQVQDPAFTPITLQVYGGDPAYASDETVCPALFPAFAAKQGDNAFAVIVDQGDAIASIRVERASNGRGFNTVSSHFSLTPVRASQKNGKPVTYVSKTSYDGDIRLCVRLLGGANAELDGLAAACREQFMRMGYLSTDTVQNEEYLPFELNLLGAVSDNKARLPQIRTTFDQAQDLLTRMKSKGINNVDVRYMGVLRGGTDPSAVGDLNFALRLGGQKNFRKLAEFMTAQGHSLFLDTTLFSYSARNRIPGNNVLTIESENATALITVGDRVYTRKLTRLTQLENTVIDLLTASKKIPIDGFCIQDASALLFSDFSEGYTDRTQSAQCVRDNLPALSADRLLMVDTGYFYAVRYADLISGLPQTSALPERAGVYTCVPFVQMILHGTLDYSGTPVNLADDSTRARLRSVEFACCPSYTWCFSRSGGEKLCYEDQLNDAVDFYQKANAALADLRDARIVDNGTAANGVRFTAFDNGATIYVNYTNSEASVGNIRVEPLSFLRIG